MANPRNIKFAVLEINGEELEIPSEYEALSDDIYYDAGKVDSIKDRIDLSALGYSSFFQYTLDRSLIIPALRSLIVTGIIIVEENTLTVEGSLEVS